MEIQTNEAAVTAPHPQNETATKVPDGTKFQKRGFRAAEAPATTPVAEPSEAEEPAEDNAMEPLPNEITFDDDKSGTEVTEPIVEEPPLAATAEDDDIVIGDKIFKSKKEAWTYAQELEREKLASDAFRQGIEAAQLSQNSNLNPAIPIEPVEEKIPDEYYTDPAKFFKKREQQMASQVQQAIDARISQINTHQATMNKFWSDYPDLAKSNATMALAQKHVTIGIQKYGKLETQKALKLIAEEARAELRELGVTTLPTKPIPSNTKPAASTGSSTAPARPKPDEKPLNWVQQMRNMKNKRFDSRRKA